MPSSVCTMAATLLMVGAPAASPAPESAVIVWRAGSMISMLLFCPSVTTPRASTSTEKTFGSVHDEPSEENSDCTASCCGRVRLSPPVDATHISPPRSRCSPQIQLACRLLGTLRSRVTRRATSDERSAITRPRVWVPIQSSPLPIAANDVTLSVSKAGSEAPAGCRRDTLSVCGSWTNAPCWAVPIQTCPPSSS